MKSMKKVPFLTIVVFSILQGCLDLRTCTGEIVGRYSCGNNENAINHLNLNEDGSFYHYYKEGNRELSHNGSWARSEKNDCVIELMGWKVFNQDGVDYEVYRNKYLFVSEDFLDISPDGSSQASFKKE